MNDDALWVLTKVLPTIVEWRKVEEGIAIRPVNQPALESVVKMTSEVRDKVWDWLHAPRVVEDKKEWKQLRKPIISILLEIGKIMTQYGRPIHREILSQALNALSKPDNEYSKKSVNR